MNEEKQENIKQFAYRSVLHWRRGDVNIIPGSTLQSRVLEKKIDDAVQEVVDYIRPLVRDIREGGFFFGDDEFYVGGVEGGYLLTNRHLFVYIEKKKNNSMAAIPLEDISRFNVKSGWTTQMTIEINDGRVVEYKGLYNAPEEADLYALRDFDWKNVAFEESSFAEVMIGSEELKSGPEEKEGGDGSSEMESWNVKVSVVGGGLIAFVFSYLVAPLIIRNEALGIDIREAFFSFVGICAAMTIGPSILRVCGFKSWFILWVLVLSYARVYQTGRSVLLTPLGVAVFGSLTYGAYAIFSRLVLDLIRTNKEKGGVNKSNFTEHHLPAEEEKTIEEERKLFDDGVCPQCGNDIDKSMTKCFRCDLDFYESGLIK
jgi:hypothetical protein